MLESGRDACIAMGEFEKGDVERALGRGLASKRARMRGAHDHRFFSLIISHFPQDRSLDFIRIVSSPCIKYSNVSVIKICAIISFGLQKTFKVTAESTYLARELMCPVYHQQRVTLKSKLPSGMFEVW